MQLFNALKLNVLSFRERRHRRARQRRIDQQLAANAALAQLQKQVNIQLADVKRRVEPPKIDATQDELLQVYGAGVWIYAGINAIAEKSASVPFLVVDEEANEIELHEMWPARPNPWKSWVQLRQLTAIWLETTGNAYWLKVNPRDYGWENWRGSVGYLPLRPSRVRVVPASNGQGILGYAYKPAGFAPKRNGNGGQRDADWHVSVVEPSDKMTEGQFKAKLAQWHAYMSRGEMKTAGDAQGWIPLQAADVIHFQYEHPFNDYYGMSPLQPLLLTFSTDMYARAWNKAFFENGAIPPVIVTVPELLGEDEFKRLKEQMDKRKGVKEAHRALLLENDAQVTVVPWQQRDMEFLSLLQFSREEALAVLGVPPVMCGVYTFSNTSGRSAGAREQRESFWKDTVLPKVEMQSEAINQRVDFGENNKLTYDTTDVEALKPDFVERAKATGLTGLTVQEVRTIFYDLGEPEDAVLIPTRYLAQGEAEDVDTDSDEDGNAQQAMPGYALVDIRSAQNKETGHRFKETGHRFKETGHRFKNADAQEAIRTSMWEKVIQEADAMESRLFRWVKRLFRAQEQRVLEALTDAYEKSTKSPEDMLTELTNLTESERQQFLEAASDEYRLHLQDAGDYGLLEAGIEGAFDMDNERVQEYLQAKVFKFASEVNETTIEALRAELQEAIQGGETIYEIRQRVQSVFSDTVRGTAKRARTIARTETIGIFNGGQHLALRQHRDLVEGYEWLSSRDDRVRDTHTQADGQRVGIDEAFRVGGAELRFPGDPQGPASEVINCRCTLLSVLKDEG